MKPRSRSELRAALRAAKTAEERDAALSELTLLQDNGAATLMEMNDRADAHKRFAGVHVPRKAVR